MVSVYAITLKMGMLCYIRGRGYILVPVMTSLTLFTGLSILYEPQIS